MRSLTLGATFLMLAALITLSTGGCGSGGSTPSSTLPILFVSDRDEPGNWDIYKLELESGAITRLTTDPAIDNHPSLSHDGTRVVFSTTRYVGNDFDLAIASDVNDIDGTAVRLTDDSLPGGPPRHYPDRHPHFSHDGALVLFSAKNRAVTVTTTEVQSECCVPIITHSVRYFENLCVIRPATDTHVILDPGDGLDAAGPNIWYVPDPAFDDDPVYIGHPSLSEDGTTILFNASVDGAGTVWNVYTVGFDPTALTIVPNSLKRITLASGATPNPIKLNGGAHFSEDESEIIFTSTLTPAGNSMLFTIPSTATDVDVGTLLPLNPTPGNDYLPMPVDDDRIVFVSDLGPASLCGGPTVPGASADLDLFVIDLDGTNLTNVTDNDAADEMLLIGDEVSWFCGLKPNLTACSKTQRIFDTEALWLTWQSTALIPDDLLQRFNLPTGAMDMYQAHWLNLSVYVNAHPHLLAPWEELWNDVNILQTGSPSLSVPPFPGLGDSLLLEEWLRASAPIRDKLYVLPSIMGPEGIPGS